MNNTALPVSELRDLRVLEELGGDQEVTQRELARKVGIALGLANTILKRMARKGMIKVRNLDAKRLAYSITPRGMQEKSRLAYRYFEQTVDFYKQARYRVKDNLLRAKAQGIHRVAIYRIDEVAEIVFLTVKELGMELALVSSPGHAGEEWLGMRVHGPEALKAGGFDAVIVTDFAPDPARYPELEGIGKPIWWLG